MLHIEGDSDGEGDEGKKHQNRPLVGGAIEVVVFEELPHRAISLQDFQLVDKHDGNANRSNHAQDDHDSLIDERV